MYQNMFNKVKAIIKEDAYMTFCDETELLNRETDASGAGLGAALLQTRSNTCYPRDKAPDNSILTPSAFYSKVLTSAEKRYSNIDSEALGILYGPEIFHHYCFVREVSIIMDHKLLVNIFKKDTATLSQRLQ